MHLPPTQKQLLHRLCDGQWRHRRDLAEATGLDDNALDAQLHELSVLGLDIEHDAQKGLRLRRALELLDRDQMIAGLDSPTQTLLNGLEIFERIASTNGHLMQQANNGRASGWVCCAESQSAGRGRRGRQWVSPLGGNIYMSMLWRYATGPGHLGGLSLAVGVAVIRALQQLDIRGVGLKWPNDIYWQGRKLGGILVEISGVPDGPSSAVVGLGLNGHLPAPCGASIGQPWVDLEQLTGGQNPGRNRLASALLNSLLPTLAHYQQGHLSQYLAEWRAHDCLQGQAVCVTQGDKFHHGVAEDVDEHGLLLVRLNNGQVRSFASGEVSLAL